MSTQPVPHLTPEEYLAIERDCEQKHGYFRGQMFAMGGASAEHNVISVNITALLHAQLKDRPCQVYANDMRLYVPTTGLYTYPDGIVTCEKPRFADDQFDTLLNPQVIIEVLSPSTENYDRSKKFEHYRQIPSLEHYVLVPQDHAIIECYSHNEQGQWYLEDARGLEATMKLLKIDCQLPLADVFAKVDFPEVTPEDLAKAGLFSDKTPRQPKP